jgi:hypothetical protein
MTRFPTRCETILFSLSLSFFRAVLRYIAAIIFLCSILSSAIDVITFYNPMTIRKIIKWNNPITSSFQAKKSKLGNSTVCMKLNRRSTFGRTCIIDLKITCFLDICWLEKLFLRAHNNKLSNSVHFTETVLCSRENSICPSTCQSKRKSSFDVKTQDKAKQFLLTEKSVI